MLKKLLFALLKRFGNSRLRQRIWNTEFRNGKWDYLDDLPENAPQERDILFDIMNKYSSAGDILDLGCGTGLTGFKISDAYRRYVGVDISEVAIGKATRMLERDQSRSRKNAYHVGDIATFIPNGTFSVILFQESLYYFSMRVIPTILHRYSAFVAREGVFIVRLHDREKYRRLITLIEENYGIVERSAPERSSGIVIVFRSRDGAG
jgi:SAM-dependent methyltransferase